MDAEESAVQGEGREELDGYARSGGGGGGGSGGCYEGGGLSEEGGS